MPCYPGTGDPAETGVDNNVVNVGLSPGTGSKEFREAWQMQILPRLRSFRPELILVSAGFDAHADDPLAELELTDDDFYFVRIGEGGDRGGQVGRRGCSRHQGRDDGR